METPTTQPTKSLSLANVLNKSSKFLEETLGSKKAEFVSNLLALSEADKSLQECNAAELMKCALNATALDLPLNKNLGYAYVIAYKDYRTQGVVPQFQMGYKGFIQLAIRSGQYQTINACEVRKGEIIRNKFTGQMQFLGEEPHQEVIGYLAYIKLLNGFEQSLYMSVEELAQHAAQYSKSGFNKAKGELQGIWANNFDAMAKKTVLKLLLSRYGVLSVSMQQAILQDQASLNGEYIDNPQTYRTVVDAEVITQEEPTLQEQATRVSTQEANTINLKDL